MHHFIVIHSIKHYPETQDEWLNLWETVLSNTCGDSRWINSYYDPIADQLYCLWEAESEDQIQACFSEEAIEMAPIEDVREVAYFDIQALADGGD